MSTWGPDRDRTVDDPFDDTLPTAQIQMAEFVKQSVEGTWGIPEDGRLIDGYCHPKGVRFIADVWAWDDPGGKCNETGLTNFSATYPCHLEAALAHPSGANMGYQMDWELYRVSWHPWQGGTFPEPLFDVGMGFAVAGSWPSNLTANQISRPVAHELGHAMGEPDFGGGHGTRCLMRGGAQGIPSYTEQIAPCHSMRDILNSHGAAGAGQYSQYQCTGPDHTR
jgi:hypothetical protein